MRNNWLAAVVVAGLAWQSPAFLAAEQDPVERELRLSFDAHGLVTLTAKNVTIREILTEWSRQGGVTFVNAEQLTGGPVVMLQFENRPEVEVIDSLLRSAAGYILGPRTVRSAGPSQFEAVVILAASNPTTSRGYSTGVAPVAAPLRTPGSPDDEIPPVTPVGNPADSTAPPNSPAVGTSSPGVFIVPIQPVNPATGRGGTTPPPTGGRGRGGRGSGS